MLCAHIESLPTTDPFFEFHNRRNDDSFFAEDQLGRLDDGRLALIILTKLMDFCQDKKIQKNISDSELKKGCMASETLFFTMCEYFMYPTINYIMK